MKKVRGKALALVLSIALVVSSFSTAFSSAASHSEKAVGFASGSKGIVDQYLVNGGNTSDGTLSVVLDGTTDHVTTELVTAKHLTADGSVAAISHASGTPLVKWELEDTDNNDAIDQVTLTLRGKDVAGTETLNILYKGTIEDGDDTIKVSYTDQAVITVFDNKSVVISDNAAAPDPGTDARFDQTFAQKTTADEVAATKVATDEDSEPIAVYQATLGNTDAKVTWTDAASAYDLSTSSNVLIDTTAKRVQVAEDALAGNVTLTAERNTTGNADPDTYPDKKVTVKTKITKTILVNDNANLEHFVRSGSTTYLADATTKDSATKAVSVNGYEVNFPTVDVDGSTAVTARSVTVEARASVDKISGTVTELSVYGGPVKTIDLAAGDVTVSGEKSKAGDITTAGDVTVDTGATVGAIDGAAVTVTDAKTGDITASGVAAISADAEDAVTSTGDITAGANVSLSTGDDTAKLSIGTLKADADQLEFDVSGKTTIGGADFNYYDTTLAFNDFQGKVPAPQNVQDGAGTISTASEEDSVEVTGVATLGTVTAEDETTITFDNKATVNNIDGSGSIVIKAGNLTVVDGLYGVTLKLSDEPITSGLKIFKASAGAVDVDDFTPYGYTLKVVEGDDYDTFSVDALQFVGLKINGNGRIVKEDSATFTASAYPTGSPIPEGYTVDWSIDNTDKFTATKNADGSVTVEAANFDEDFASENKGVLTATLIDEDGYEYDEDYEPGTLDLTEIKVPDTTYKSDTTGNVALGLGQTYQFKITSLDGKPVTFAVASKGATVTLANASGNDYYYKVTGAKLGNYGVYVNADKTPVAVLNITSNVKIDTTTVTIASGKTYQFKVTAPAQPTFQVAGLGTIALAQKTGNDYFYKVTANNVKGGHGVYVNGARLAIATFA